MITSMSAIGWVTVSLASCMAMTSDRPLDIHDKCRLGSLVPGPGRLDSVHTDEMHL